MTLLTLIKLVLLLALVGGVWHSINRRGWRHSTLAMVIDFLAAFLFSLLAVTTIVGSLFFILQVH